MKRLVIALFFFLGITSLSYSQKPDEILEEGKLLYRLEKASWYGSDCFMAQFQDKIGNVGGYLSYIAEDDKVMNIFFDKTIPSRILARFKFDSLPQEKPLSIDTLNNSATQLESDLIALRQDAIKRITENEDGFFTFYDNTSPNLIPLIRGKKRQVFLLTGPKVSNLVLLGNDYLFTYDKKNRFKKKEKIHNSLIRFTYRSDNPEKPMTATIHSHVLSDYITSTDICTLLLYKDFVEWKKHYVMSEKYVSIFDMEEESLTVITREDWEKMNEQK